MEKTKNGLRAVAAVTKDDKQWGLRHWEAEAGTVVGEQGDGPIGCSDQTVPTWLYVATCTSSKCLVGQEIQGLSVLQIKEDTD